MPLSDIAAVTQTEVTGQFVFFFFSLDLSDNIPFSMRATPAYSLCWLAALHLL